MLKITATNLYRIMLYAAASSLMAACGGSSPVGGNISAAAANETASQRWVSAWGTANYTTFPNGPLTLENFEPSDSTFPNNEAVEQSFRMMIHPTVQGDRLRFRFENTFGDRPLTIRNVSVAIRAAATGPAIVAETTTPVMFSGVSESRIPAGEVLVSDGVDFSYAVGDDLAISFHIPGPSGPMSWHSESFSSQYISSPNSGDVTGDASGSNFANIDRGWFFLAGMDSQISPPEASDTAAEPFTIVAFGDSITDGFAGTLEVNHRWPDFFAQRLQAMSINAGVVNVGINSNSVIPARSVVTTGPPGIQRFARDVLSRSNVRSVFVLLGTNDITADKTADEIYAGLLNLRDQAHAAGICIVVSTILPRNDPPQPFMWNVIEHSPVREALNAMILNGNDFDAVTDAVATAMENPAIENQPNNALFVEGLHPNSAGMQVLANAVPMEPLLPPPLGSCSR